MAQQKAIEAPAEEVEDLVDELQPGTKLLKGQYTIVRYINSGGFGITYLAKDSLDRNVVIKECFPSSYCRRSKTMVAARSRAHTAELRSVVQLFVREARHLSKIVHPNIVAVHQVFEDNGTAYMAIDFVDGLDLQQIIEGQGRKLSIDDIVQMTEKLLAAVGFIHANDMLHRDISPDNVLIDKKGQPVLIDFGAAREQASQSNRAMSALRVVKDGYSPQEFYIAGSEQGPWSDLYALGATMYHVISGEAPVNGQARLAALAEDQTDPYVPLDGRFAGYPPGFLAAIDKALSTLPRQRVQSAQEWLTMFRPDALLPIAPTSEETDAAAHAISAGSRSEATARTEPLSSAPGAFGAPPELGKPGMPPQPKPQDVGPKARIAGRSGMPVQMIGGIAAALVVVGVGVMLMGADEAPAPHADAMAATEPAAEPAQPVATVSTASEGTQSAAAAPAVTEPPAQPATGAPAETEAPAAEVAVMVEPAAETPVAPAEAVAAEVPAEAEPTVPAPQAPVVLQENQIGFAAWDVQMPFIEDNRMIGGQRVAIVLRLLPNVDVAEAGDWLANGLILHKVNGVDIQQAGSITTAVLNAMKVDPDGKARVVVEYSGSSLDRQTGLMAVPATRLVSLANGVNVTISTVEGEWKAVVTGITRPEATDLRQGDILFRDKTTGVAIDGPDTLETVMAALVEADTPVTEFSIIRDNRLANAYMHLAAKTGQ